MVQGYPQTTSHVMALLRYLLLVVESAFPKLQLIMGIVVVAKIDDTAADTFRVLFM